MDSQRHGLDETSIFHASVAGPVLTPVAGVGSGHLNRREFQSRMWPLRKRASMLSGECNCGKVMFEAHTHTTDVYVCHCSICRRHTGTIGNAVVVVEKDAFRWVSGEHEICTWRKPGHDWQIWFCRTCGSQVPGENDERRMFVPAGLISVGAENLRVAHHIWVDSRASWDEIGPSGRRHAEEFRKGS